MTGLMKANKMKVLLVIRNIVYAGASKSAVLVANALNDRGHNVAVVTYNNDHVGMKLGEGIIYFPGKKNNRITEYAYAIRCIRKVALDYSPDIVLGFRDNASALSIVALCGTKIPIVVCERSDPYMESNLSLRLSRKLFIFAAGGVFQTQQAGEYYNNLVKFRKVIPNPVMPLGTACTKPFVERANEIVNVARLDIRQKRQDVLIKSFKRVHQKYPSINLSFLGAGDDEKLLKNMVEELGLNKNVFFHGKVTNVSDYLVRSKFFVLSSDYEGISNALIESMSLGLPSISTDTSPGGARVLVEDGKNGFIVPCGDEEALAEKMLFYLEHPEVADAHGAEAKKIAEKYSPELIFNMWEDFLLEIIKKNHRR